MSKKITELERHQLNESKRFRDGERRILESELTKRWAVPIYTLQRFRRDELIKAYRWQRTFGYHPRDILRVEAQCLGLIRNDDIEKYIQHEMLPLLKLAPLWTDGDIALKFGWSSLPNRRQKSLIDWARQNGLKAIKFSQKVYRYRECDVLAFDYKCKNQHAA